jgi:hypothetical protein
VRTAPAAVCPAQIRVIDATAVERQAKNANVKTHYRHHPRHAKSQMQARVRADGSFGLAEEEDAEQQNDDGAEEPTTVHGAAGGDGAGGEAGSQHVHLAGATTAAAKPAAAAAAAHLAPNASGAAVARAPNASIARASNHSSQDATTAASAAASASASAAASAPAAARPTPTSAKEAAREISALSRLSQAAARREGVKQLQHLSRMGHGGPSIPVESAAGPRSQALADAEASRNHT